MLVSVEYCELSVKSGDGDGDGEGGGCGNGVFISKEKFENRILRLLVNPVPCSYTGSGNSSSATIGYFGGVWDRTYRFWEKMQNAFC